MPRASTASLPISGLFAVEKPSGPTSMAVVETIKHLVARSRLFVEAEKLQEAETKGKSKRRHKHREAVKIGQGGTLDPLADGVLVIGVGKGTKELGQFLNCTKEYTSTCLLGSETDSYDKEGSIVRRAPWTHVTREAVETALPPFRGNIQQTPPIFSALKMDGFPLYHYARKGIPLPRPIEPRPVNVESFEVIEWYGNGHEFREPEKSLSTEEKAAVETALSSVESEPTMVDAPGAEAADVGEGAVPTAFKVAMTVSGGTYVRSLVHDLAHAVGSSGHVVTLTRTRQGRFALKPEGDTEYGCVPWDVFARAEKEQGERDADGWTEWERAVLDRLELVER